MAGKVDFGAKLRRDETQERATEVGPVKKKDKKREKERDREREGRRDQNRMFLHPCRYFVWGPCRWTGPGLMLHDPWGRATTDASQSVLSPSILD